MACVLCGCNFSKGETYNIKLVVYDLINPEAEININMDVEVIK